MSAQESRPKDSSGNPGVYSDLRTVIPSAQQRTVVALLEKILERENFFHSSAYLVFCKLNQKSQWTYSWLLISVRYQLSTNLKSSHRKGVNPEWMNAMSSPFFNPWWGGRWPMLSLLPDQWSNLVIMTSPSISHAQRVQFLDSMSSLAQSIIVLTVLFSNSTHQVRQTLSLS